MLNIIKYNIIFIFLFVILHVYKYDNSKVYAVDPLISDDGENVENKNVNNKNVIKKDMNEPNEHNNMFHSILFPFNNGIMSSPLSLFNISPFDISFQDAFFNNIFNNSEENMFNENLEFNVTHPKGDLCKFLIEWQKGMKVKSISVDVDIKKRLIILKYSHKQETDESQTTETAYLEEYIHPSCLLTDEVINQQKAAFAVKDEEGATAVQIWFPEDPNYVKSAEDESESATHVSQYSKSKSCVRNIRNGRCNEVTTKTITTPGTRIHTRVFSSHSVPEDEKAKKNIQGVPPKVEHEEENIEHKEEEDRRNEKDINTYMEEKYEKEEANIHTDDNSNKQMKIKHMSSEDDNAHTHGVDVTSSILHLPQKHWRDEL